MLSFFDLCSTCQFSLRDRSAAHAYVSLQLYLILLELLITQACCTLAKLGSCIYDEASSDILHYLQAQQACNTQCYQLQRLPVLCRYLKQISLLWVLNSSSWVGLALLEADTKLFFTFDRSRVLLCWKAVCSYRSRGITNSTLVVHSAAVAVIVLKQFGVYFYDSSQADASGEQHVNLSCDTQADSRTDAQQIALSCWAEDREEASRPAAARQTL